MGKLKDAGMPVFVIGSSRTVWVMNGWVQATSSGSGLLVSWNPEWERGNG